MWEEHGSIISAGIISVRGKRERNTLLFTDPNPRIISCERRLRCARGWKLTDGHKVGLLSARHARDWPRPRSSLLNEEDEKQFFKLKGTRQIYNAWNKMAASRPLTCTAAKRRATSPPSFTIQIRDPASTGSFSAIVANIKLALTLLWTIKPRSPATVHVCCVAKAGGCENLSETPRTGGG